MEKLPVEQLPVTPPKIHEIRGQRVLLDSDLAALYGVSTKRLNEQVRRNADRFPADFLLELSNQEVAALRSQFATLNTGRGTHRKYRPVAFTEHGAIMAATILNSPRAAQMSVYVVRAFVKLRSMRRYSGSWGRESSDSNHPGPTGNSWRHGGSDARRASEHAGAGKRRVRPRD